MATMKLSGVVLLREEVVIRVFSYYLPVSLALLVGIEFVLLALAVHAGAYLRLGSGSLGWLTPVTGASVAFAIIMQTMMNAMGLYRDDDDDSPRVIALKGAVAFSLGAAVIAALFYVYPDVSVGRGVMWRAWLIGLLSIIALRTTIWRRSGLEFLKRRVLVLGVGDDAAQVGSALQARRGHGVDLVGYYALDLNDLAVDASRVIPSGISLVQAARNKGVQEIVVAVRDRRGGRLPLEELLACKLMGITVTELTTFIERVHGQVPLESLKASWLIFGGGFQRDMLRASVKRGFDILVSVALLTLALPVMALSALMIKLQDGGRVLYRQVRVGQGGQTFSIYKFRSMRENAEADGVARWANANDSRVTRFGAFMRKTRIDELPQLFNVLRGEMSFVGPRPERPEFVAMLAREVPYYQARHSIKPGLTGWAQVRFPYGASVEDATRKLQYDLYYVKNHSLALDFQILLETVQVVLFGQGAR